MSDVLVVSLPFGDYQKGDRITDPKTVEETMKRHPTHVQRITVEDAPKQAPAAEPSKPAAQADEAAKAASESAKPTK